MTLLMETHPHLAAQLHDRDLASKLSAGSGKKVAWVCTLDPRHVWTAAVYSRVAGSGCAVCAGKKVITGVNDLATTHPDLAAQLVDPAQALTVSAGSHRKLLWQCDRDLRHQWLAKVSMRRAGRGCAICANKVVVPGINDLATTHGDLVQQLMDPTQGELISAGSTKKVMWQCSADAAHVYQMAVLVRAKRGAGCPICSGHRVVAGVNDLASTHAQLARQLVDPTLGACVSAGSVKKVAWRCGANHEWTATVSNRVAGNGCPVCSGQVVATGINDLATTHPLLAAQLVDPQLARTVTAGSKQVLLWQCSTNPAHQWPAACYHRSGPAPTRCPQCFGSLPSQREDDLAAAVARLVPSMTMRRSVRDALGNGQELDILLQDPDGRRVAIEFNGLFWHSQEAGKARDYHAAKLAAAGAVGIELIQVWEDDWRDRPQIVLRALAHRLHAVDQLRKVLPQIDPEMTQRLFARALVPGQISNAQAAEFMDEHHLQGRTSTTANFVLRDADGRARAVLGLRSPAHNARMQRAVGQWDIQRYATAGVVVGGFSRLLAHAQRALLASGEPLTQWVSFSADDLSDGGMYAATGFSAAAHLPPDYTYAGNITGWTRTPKESFQRRTFRDRGDLVWDEGWSEREAAAANGLVRIYDAGKTKWVKSVR